MATQSTIESQLDTPSAESGPPSRLYWFLLKHAFIGFTAGALFVAAMLFFDVGRLTTLVVGSDVGLLAVSLLTLMVGLTFASLQMGWAVMFQSDQIGRRPRCASDPLASAQEMKLGALQPRGHDHG